ncbi:hypothetical protein FQN54_009372 [Arachnomyces sp. PD_36]|nr:hypothetical protein FQN54_009372 [Arachnomyces sp. PD_36]
MLKPFQIRDLYDPSVQPDSALPIDSNQGSISSESNHTSGWDKLESQASNDYTTQGPQGLNASNNSLGESGRGIIQISAHEYDETVARHPQNSLMYMDDDDGETVTVGSSFELAQRLDEPIDSSASLSSLPGSHSPYQMITSPVHIFDIRRSRSTVDLWRDFERRTFEQIGTPGIVGPASPRSSIVGTLPSEPACSPEITESYPKIDNSASQVGQDSPRDPRADWLLACEPPHLSFNGSAAESNVSLENPFRDNAHPIEDGIGGKEEFSKSQPSLRSVGSSCSITEEGRRQAQEAGAKFRTWQRTPTNNAASSTLAPENPWALYNKRQARFDDPVPEGVSQTEPEPQKTASITEEVNQPLLAAFEAQMSKIMEETAAAQAQGHSPDENNTDKTDDSPEPPTSEREPPPSASRPPPTPADVLAQAVNHMVAGATRLSTELGHRVPEIERQLSNAHGRLPDHLESTVQGGLRTIGSHIHALANASHNASFAAHQAAYRTRAAQHQAIEQLVAERLRGVAGDLSNIGRTIFSSLEAGLGASRPAAHPEPSAHGSQPTANRDQGMGSTEVGETPNADPSVSVKEAESDTHPKDDSLNPCLVDTAERDAQQTGQPPKSDSAEVSTSTPCAAQNPVPQQPLPETTTSGNNLQERSPRDGIFPTAANPYRKSYSTCPPVPGHGLPRRHGRSRSPLSFRPLRSNPSNHAGSDYRSMAYKNTGRPQCPVAETPLSPPNNPIPGSAESLSAPVRPVDTMDTLFLRIPGAGVTETAIQNLLAEQGFLAKIYLRKSTMDGTGFAYLKFPSIYAARGAKEALQGVYLGGEVVFVAFSGANFDTLQKYAESKPDASSPQPHSDSENLQSKGHEATSANEHDLGDPSEVGKNLKAKPSVTFANPDDTANTTSIKRHRSLGAFPPAWGGPFPYRRPFRSTVKPSNNSFDLKKSEDVRTGDSSKKVDDALLDRMDVDDDFSARYPSLFATQGLRRSNTIASAPKQKASLRTATSPESEMERFPTVSQFEAQSQAQHLSNLPSNSTHTLAQKPLNSGSNPGSQESGFSRNPLHDFGITNKLPGSWPHETQDNAPSDFADWFNKKFEAKEERLNNQRRSNSLVSANPAARLSGPFDPVRESYRSGRETLPRRSATERQPNHPVNHGFQHHRVPYRRPRGDFRREEPSWESYVDRPRNLSGESVPQPPNNVPATNTAQPEMAEWPSTRPNVQGQGEINVSEPPARPKSKVDACVEHLKALGFLNDGEHGDQRLSVYASAVNGNLGDAIEMIEEERKAYEQQPSLV